MRPYVAVRLNSVEQTLAGVLVTLKDVPVLAKTGVVLCLPSQIVEVLSVESFHALLRPSSHESSDDLANRSINGKLSLKEAAATVWQIVSL
jgi:hypothetical protein